MASKQLFRKLPEDVICPMCMEILQEPVTIDCGHNFCLRCITQIGEASEDFILCPICKAVVSRRTFQPNKQLESRIENIQDMEKEESELRCQWHNENLLYFCEEDREFLCSVCCDSKDHKFHNVNLREEAAQNYQVHIKSLNIQEKFKHLRKNLKEEGRDMGVTLSRSQGFQFTNPTLVPVDMEDRFNEAASRHESTNESMKKLTDERKVKDQKKKDERLFWHSLKAEKMESCPLLSGENKEERKIKDKKKKDKRLFWHSLKEEKMDSWSSPTEENKGSCLSGESKDMLTTSAPVTLNPASADPELTLSRDLKTVSLQPLRGRAGNKQAKPRPFDRYHWVLGSQGLYSGHLIWEVKLQGTDKGACVVGVATELAPGQHRLKHIWALQISDSECQPITENDAHENFPIFLKNVGIYLDRDHGKVTFFNPATDEHIYTFQESFTGQVFPFFGLLNPGSQITLIP